MTPYIFAGLHEPSKRAFRKDLLGKLISVVCRSFNLKSDDVKSKSRKKEMSEARFIIIGIMEELQPNFGLRRLGNVLGGRDHSTILYGREIFKDLNGRDKKFTDKVNLIKSKL